MEEKEIIERINALCKARSWTSYRLAKESNITYSTLFTMLHKANSPSIPTLIKICDGFGITLAQFFDGNDDQVLLSETDKEHLLLWNRLSAENQRAAEKYINYLLATQEQAEGEKGGDGFGAGLSRDRAEDREAAKGTGAAAGPGLRAGGDQ